MPLTVTLGIDPAALVAQEKSALTRRLTAAMDQTMTGMAVEARAALSPDGRGLARLLGATVTPPPSGGVAPTGSLFGRGAAGNRILPPFLDGGQTVILPKQGRYLCFPTGFNGAVGQRGRAERGVRVTPDAMVSSGVSFTVPMKSGRGLLWCLPVADKATMGRRRRLSAAGLADVATSHVKGRDRWLNGLLAQGFVPMFFLLRSVTITARLDLAAVADRWAARFPEFLPPQD